MVFFQGLFKLMSGWLGAKLFVFICLFLLWLGAVRINYMIRIEIQSYSFLLLWLIFTAQFIWWAIQNSFIFMTQTFSDAFAFLKDKLLKLLVFAALVFLILSYFDRQLWIVLTLLLASFAVFNLPDIWHFLFVDNSISARDAKYAQKEEIEDMLITPDSEERHKAVLLGAGHEQLYALSSGHGGRAEMGHILITGPTRSGKGRNLTTNLLNWSGSAITLDIKGENYENTAHTREALGKVYKLDPSGTTHRFDPFKAMSYSDEGLKALATIILDSGDDKEQVFAQRATAALFAGIKASILQRQATLPYLEEQIGKGIINYCIDLWATNDKTVQRNLVQFLGVQPDQIEAESILQDRFLMSSWQTLVTRLDPLFSKGILNMFSGNDFEPQDLVTEPSSLYLVFRESDFDSTQKAFQIIMLSLMLSLIRYYDDENTNTIPLLWCLDEAGRVPIPRLPELIATIAGRNMSALLYIQTLSQLESAYGKQKAATLRDNCRTQLYHPTSDTTTQDYIIKQAGTYESFQTAYTESTDSEGKSNTGTSNSLKEKNLISNDEIRMQDPDTIYIFTANKAPILAQRLEPWMLE